MAERLLVCGGRTFNDPQWVAAELRRYDKTGLIIICGYDPDDSRFQGADQLVFEWALTHHIPVFPFPAPWKQFGRSAGPRRNRRMRDWGKPTKVLAFPGGRGTDDMCHAASEKDIPVSRLTPEAAALPMTKGKFRHG